MLADSLRIGKRAAALMSLIQSAKLNGNDVYAYLKDVLTRLPTQRASEIVSCCRIDGIRLSCARRDARTLNFLYYKREINLSASS